MPQKNISAYRDSPFKNYFPGRVVRLYYGRLAPFGNKRVFDEKHFSTAVDEILPQFLSNAGIAITVNGDTDHGYCTAEILLIVIMLH